MDEKKFETLSEQQQKKFLFKENIRLNELSQSLEEDRQLIDIQKGMLRSQQRKNQLMKKQLESQQSLFDQKWTILEKRQDSLQLTRRGLTEKSLCTGIRCIAKHEELWLMQKMSRYSLKVLMILTLLRNVTKIC